MRRSQDTDNPETLARWLYAAGVTNDRPGTAHHPVGSYRYTIGKLKRELNIQTTKSSQVTKELFRGSKKPPYRMTFRSLVCYFKMTGFNWVFPNIDTSEYTPKGGPHKRPIESNRLIDEGLELLLDVLSYGN